MRSLSVTGTPRDVVAQALDYGSWVQGLGLDDLEQIYLDHQGGETHLGEAFAQRFDSPLPDIVNAEQQFTIIAAELDGHLPVFRNMLPVLWKEGQRRVCCRSCGRDSKASCWRSCSVTLNLKPV